MAAHSRRRLSLLFVSVLCLACAARAQTGGGSVRMTGGVSETVALSLPQGAEASDAGVRVTSSRETDRSLTVTLSGTTRALTKLRIPFLIRSNTGYKVFATAKAAGSNLSSLLVVGASPTGTLVAADAAQALGVADAFDGRRGLDNPGPAGGFDRPNLSTQLELLSGPRVSLGGTLLTPQNALEVVLSLAVEPQADTQGWTVELQLSAAPAGL